MRQEPIWGKGDELRSSSPSVGDELRSSSPSVGDELTLKVLGKLRLSGSWLGLAAGDGRYVPELLEKINNLVASDIDRSLLGQLLHRTPKEKRHRLKIKVFDLTKKFPFDDKSFDGLFCTGTLHLFPKEVLYSVFAEIDRVLKPKGKVIIDFATDIKRRFPDGKLKIFKNEPQYKLRSAKQFLKNLLKDYDIKIYESAFADDLTKMSRYGYKTTGKFILLIADKQSCKI